jgi:archaemetzincin
MPKRCLIKWCLIFGLAVAALSCRGSSGQSSQIETPQPQSQTQERTLALAPEDIVKAMKAVEPLFKLRGEPQPYEWLATFPEDGQTFEQYINGTPTLPTAERRAIYIQPIGIFDTEQKKVVELTAEFLSDFYNLPVKLLPDKKFDEPLSLENYRIHPQWKTKQIRTGYVLDKVLRPALPEDAAALIAFTNEDLYPDESMNFVFGQASLENRVGVWSLKWLRDRAYFQLFLLRTLKIAAHETGHMFSIKHCTKYYCVMSGTNGTVETDSSPLDVCPECMAKIAWGMKYPPAERYQRLAEFCEKNGLEAEGRSFRQKQAAVEAVN